MFENERNTFWGTVPRIWQKLEDNAGDIKLLFFSYSAWERIRFFLKFESSKYPDVNKIFEYNKHKIAIVREYDEGKFICEFISSLRDSDNSSKVGFFFGNWFINEAQGFHIEANYNDNAILPGEIGFFYKELSANELYKRNNCEDKAN